MAGVSLWGSSRFGVAGGDLERCLTEGGPRNIIFRSEVQATRTYCGRSLFLRSQAGLNMPCRAMEGRGGVNECHGARSLMARELHGAADGDLELRESAVFCT